MTATELCAACSTMIKPKRHCRVVVDHRPYHSGCAPKSRRPQTGRAVVEHSAPTMPPPPELDVDPVADPLGLYAVLGLKAGVDGKAIKDRYRRLSAALHPDRPGGDPDRYARISAAYDVLGDPEAKARYDSTGGLKPSEDRVRASAAEVLLMCFDRFLSDVADPDKVSFIDFAAGLIDKIEHGNREDMLRIESDKSKLIKVRRRLKAPAGHALFRNLDHRLRQLTELLAKGEERSWAIKRARTDLRSIDYEADADTDPFALPNEMRVFMRPTRSW